MSVIAFLQEDREIYKKHKPFSLSQADKFLPFRGLNDFQLACRGGGAADDFAAKNVSKARKLQIDYLKARLYDVVLLKVRHDAFAKEMRDGVVH